MINLPKNKYTNAIIFYAATVAAVVVSVSRFIYNSWIENDMSDKLGKLIYRVSYSIERVAHAVRIEVAPEPKLELQQQHDLTVE